MPKRTKVFLIAAAFFAIGLLIVAWRVGGKTTGACPGQPSAIEAVTPRCGAIAQQQQSAIKVDLAPGYQGRLVVNGTEIPDDQATFVAPLNELTYQPAPGKVVAKLLPSQNQVEVFFWLTARGPEESSRYTWFFTAS